MTDTALVARPLPSSPAPAEPNEVLERLQAVKNALAPDLTDQELQLFAMVAARSGLDPFAKQIYAIKRQGRVTFQTGIDGYRSTAARTNEYRGSDEPIYSGPCPCGQVPKGHPETAQVTVYRLIDGERQPQTATAWFDEFMPTAPNDHMWKKMPRNQLAKCAEALALRKAFPYVLADVYVAEEMDQVDSRDRASAETQRIAALPTAGDRLAARRAAIEAPDTASPSSPHADGGGEAGEASPAAVEQPDTVDGEVVSETPTPAAAACGWKLGRGAGKAALECTSGEMHAGKHSWDEVAIREGGKVIRPAD